MYFLEVPSSVYMEVHVCGSSCMYVGVYVCMYVCVSLRYIYVLLSVHESMFDILSCLFYLENSFGIQIEILGERVLPIALIPHLGDGQQHLDPDLIFP